MTELIHIANGMDWDDFALRQIPVMIGLILGALIPVLWRWAWGATRWTARTAWGIPRKAWRLCASAVRRVNNFVFRREAKPKPESGYAARRRKMSQRGIHEVAAGEWGVTYAPIAASVRAFTRAVRRSTQPMSVAIHYPVGEDAPDNIKIAEGIPDSLGKADGVAVPNTFSFDAINANRKALGLSTNPGEPSTMQKLIAVVEEDGHQLVDIKEERGPTREIFHITIRTKLSDEQVGK